MHSGTLRALEFDRIVEVVRGLAVTPLGEARLGALAPERPSAAVEPALALTSEAARFLVDYPGFPLRAPGELEAILDTLAVEGRALDAPRLPRSPASSSRSSSAASTVRRAGSREFPAAARHRRRRGLVRERSRRGPADHRPDGRGVRPCVARSCGAFATGCESSARGCAGRSSPTCAARTRPSTCRTRSSRTATAATCCWSGPSTGRPSRASSTAAPRAAPASSSSRCRTVEINNEIVALQEQEAAEVRRILLALTDAFRRRPRICARTLEAATEFDVAQACGRFSRMVDGVAPLLSAATAASSCGRRGIRCSSPPSTPGSPTERADRPRERRTSPPVPVDLSSCRPTSVLVDHGPEHRRQDGGPEDGRACWR